jgi:hypothetical protein
MPKKIKELTYRKVTQKDIYHDWLSNKLFKTYIYNHHLIYEEEKNCLCGLTFKKIPWYAHLKCISHYNNLKQRYLELLFKKGLPYELCIIIVDYCY